MAKRELIVTADGRERSVVVDGPLPGEPGERASGAARFRLTIDGVERIVDARAIRPGTWSLLVDGAQHVVDLDPRRGGAIAASVGPGEVVLTLEDARQRRLAAAAGAGRTVARGESIRAPIAGKVVKLLLAVGDTVAPGQPVIVLEAMKMENELVAERGGVVGALHKQAGQAVDTGDLLAELT